MVQEDSPRIGMILNQEVYLEDRNQIFHWFTFSISVVDSMLDKWEDVVERYVSEIIDVQQFQRTWNLQDELNDFLIGIC